MVPLEGFCPWTGLTSTTVTKTLGRARCGEGRAVLGGVFAPRSLRRSLWLAMSRPSDPGTPILSQKPHQFLPSRRLVLGRSWVRKGLVPLHPSCSLLFFSSLLCPLLFFCQIRLNDFRGSLPMILWRSRGVVLVNVWIDKRGDRARADLPMFRVRGYLSQSCFLLVDDGHRVAQRYPTSIEFSMVAGWALRSLGSPRKARHRVFDGGFHSMRRRDFKSLGRTAVGTRGSRVHCSVLSNA